MKKIKVIDYLIQELQKIGINDFFGLPGDYCFKVIDAVEKNPNTKWVGCTNELNAGYAADGYARIKGYGAIITTYNVGELSAFNATAGSFSENVPVIHIVGSPSTKYIKSNSLIHHNFCRPNYFASYEAFKYYTQYSAFLTQKNAKEEIDKALSVFIKEKKPVYISIPVDVCDTEIENISGVKEHQSNKENLIKAAEHALSLIDNAENPIVIGDVLIERFSAVKEFRNFIENSAIPATVLLMGKGVINESSPNFIGTYLGKTNNLNVYNYVNSSDCPICIGTIFSDFNTLKFDISISPSDFIEIQGTYTIIKGKKYEDVLMKDIINLLARQISKKSFNIIKDRPVLDCPASSGEFNLNFMHMNESFQKFLKQGDCIFSDTGILNFFPALMTFPDDVIWYNQLLWSSIGWATPAVFGAIKADNEKRMILLTGEGAHQLTFQSVSNMIFHNLKPIIFVLNNSGYTIERVLSQKPDDPYNNIVPWDYTKLIKAFSDSVFTAQVRSNKEFDDILNIIESENQNKMCYIELFSEKMELPCIMQKLY